MCEEVITTGRGSRLYKICRCAGCGQQSRCIPSNDFYTLGETHPLYDAVLDGGEDARLFGECCFWPPVNAATIATAQPQPLEN